VESIYNDIPKERKDIFVLTQGIPLPSLLKEETKQIAQDIKSQYEENADDIWVNNKLELQAAFMQEKNAAFSFTGYEFADENSSK
jgi:Ribonuclease G/E